MKIERAQGLAWRKVGDETIVIHLGRRRIFGLDEAGGRIWEALEKGADLGELEQAVSGDVVIGAIQRFVADLANEGLVEARESSNLADDSVIDFPSPRIQWREELLRFAGACALVGGQSPVCDQQPGSS